MPPVRLRPEDVRRTIAIVVDDLGMSHDSVYFARKALKKFVEQQIQEGDLVAIIRSGGGIGALQQFTADKRQLSAAIERVEVQSNEPRRRGFFFFGVGSACRCRNSCFRCFPEYDRYRGDDIDALREDLFAVGTLGALNYVIRGLRELPGRKSVVLFSGSSLNYRIEGTPNFRVQNAMDRLIDLANRASVVIYLVDAGVWKLSISRPLTGI